MQAGKHARKESKDESSDDEETEEEEEDEDEGEEEYEPRTRLPALSAANPSFNVWCVSLALSLCCENTLLSTCEKRLRLRIVQMPCKHVGWASNGITHTCRWSVCRGGMSQLLCWRAGVCVSLKAKVSIHHPMRPSASNEHKGRVKSGWRRLLLAGSSRRFAGACSSLTISMRADDTTETTSTITTAVRGQPSPL